ncbi:DUF1189 domain-containing protein [Salibacterium sp. K-3]
MNIIQTFLKSLYSPGYIGRFRFKGIGRTIGFVFFLMLAASIPSAITLTSSVIGGINQIETALTHEEMPAFSISGGEIVSQGEPYVDTTDEQKRRIVFDAEGRFSADEMESLKEQHNVTAFLEEEFVLNAGGEQRSFSYDLAGGFTISKSELASLIDGAGGLLFLFIPAAVLLMYLFTTALKFIGICTLSVYGLLIRKQSPLPLSYRQIWIMCAYAVTMPTILFTIIHIMPGQFPDYLQNMMYWFTAFVWLAVIYRKLPVPKKKRQQ